MRFSEFLYANAQEMLSAELWVAELGKDQVAKTAQVQGQVCHQGLGQWLISLAEACAAVGTLLFVPELGSLSQL